MTEVINHKQQLIYEGKAKRVFATKHPEELVVDYKDSLTAFNAQKKGSFAEKGKINREITVLIFKYLEKNAIQTHLLQDLGGESLLVKRLKIIPFEVVVRNVVAGSLAAKLKIAEGTALKSPVVEFYFKDDALGDPFVSKEQILSLNWESPETLAELERQALQINSLLKILFAKAKLELVDFKLEFGRDASGRILLGDEITPDCCRLWDFVTKEKFDKDRFRRDLGGVENAYQQVLQRLQSII